VKSQSFLSFPNLFGAFQYFLEFFKIFEDIFELSEYQKISKAFTKAFKAFIILRKTG
jgi:hypothetical protein